MKKRILVVDDDASVRDSLRKVLTETGLYEVALASDGLEGESALRNQPVDLLILDLNMPNRDGWDVLGTTTADTPLLPVILITGMYDQLDTTMIPGVGALMNKPIDVQPLLETIEYLLAKSLDERLARMQSGSHFEPWIRVTQVERQSCG